MSSSGPKTAECIRDITCTLGADAHIRSKVGVWNGLAAAAGCWVWAPVQQKAGDAVSDLSTHSGILFACLC